jgi:hypothetical protein
MKKFVCTKIRVIEDRFVTSVSGNVVVFTSGRSWDVITFTNASIAEELSKSFAGNLVTQTLQVEGELTTELANRLTLPVIFELTFSDGRTVVWGNKSQRCKVKASTLTIGHAAMSFERKITAFQF